MNLINEMEIQRNEIIVQSLLIHTSNQPLRYNEKSVVTIRRPIIIKPTTCTCTLYKQVPNAKQRKARSK